jgi:hypothetical protein
MQEGFRWDRTVDRTLCNCRTADVSWSPRVFVLADTDMGQLWR